MSRIGRYVIKVGFTWALLYALAHSLASHAH